MANKFLMLIDGRSVYSPVYGTVLWEDQDLALADIERIEVIRGPGATLWGTNAVNGVINVITKKAEDTPGTLVRFHAGNEETLGVVVRRGGTLGDRAWWRITARGFRNDDLVLADGRPSRDEWSGGFVESRLDWRGRSGDGWSLQVHHQDHDRNVRAMQPVARWPFSESMVAGFDSGVDWGILSWEKKDRAGGRWSGRAWIQRGEGESGAGYVRRSTVDRLLEYAGPRTGSRRWFWGLGARNNSYRTRGVPGIYEFRPADHSDQIYSGYVQDDVRLGPGHANLVLGAKLEYTSASGAEFEPQARLRWRFNPDFMAWAAVSRSARTPTWMERSIDWLVTITLEPAPGGGVVPVVYRLHGTPAVRSEHQVAHEVGFRWSPRKNFSLDVSGYWNKYRGVTSFVSSGPRVVPPPAPHVEVTATYANESRLRFRGLDVLARWTPRENLRLEAWWSWTEGGIIDSPYDDPDEAAYERGMYLGVNPRHQLHLGASLDLRGGWEADGSVHWTDRLATGPVASWTRVDLRIGWRSPARDREWSLALRNALGRHLEFRYAIDTIEPEPAWVEPALVSRWTWRF